MNKWKFDEANRIVMLTDHSKTTRVVHLLLLLLGSRRFLISELTNRLNVSGRTVFRDMEELKAIGFSIHCNNSYYGSNPNDVSDSLKKLMNPVKEVEGRLPVKITGREREMALRIIGILSQAIEQRKSCLLYDYHSARGNTFPRKIEPFKLTASDQSLWAFDCSSSICKQFKILRMGSVEILDTTWESEHKHQLPFNDIFNLSAAEPCDTIKLQLGEIAYNILLEEFPEAKKYQSKKDNHLFTIPIADYRGAGRFVLGLMDSVKVLGTENFKQYLRDVVKDFAKF